MLDADILRHTAACALLTSYAMHTQWWAALKASRNSIRSILTTWLDCMLTYRLIFFVHAYIHAYMHAHMHELTVLGSNGHAR